MQLLNIPIIAVLAVAVFATSMAEDPKNTGTDCPTSGKMTHNAFRINPDGSQSPVEFVFKAAPGGYLINGLNVTCLTKTSDCPKAGNYKVHMKLIVPDTDKRIPVLLDVAVDKDGIWNQKMPIECVDKEKCQGVPLYGSLEYPGLFTGSDGKVIPLILTINIDKNQMLGKTVKITC